jgi:hypothetical protein
MDNLLIKYVLGEADASERREVQRLLDKDAAATERLSQFSKSLVLVDRMLLPSAGTVISAKVVPGWRAAYGRFRERLELGSSGDVQSNVGRSRALKGAAVLKVGLLNWRWAAVFIGLLALSITGYMILHRDPMTISKVGMIQLPDGSTVSLSSGARITYDRSFKERFVILEGNAFFLISSNPSKPFIVRVSDIAIRVLGTSFRVQDDKDSVVIEMKTGAVAVSRGSYQRVVKAGEVLKVFRSAPDMVVRALKDTVPAAGKDSMQARDTVQPVRPKGRPRKTPIAARVARVPPVKKGGIPTDGSYDPRVVFRQIIQELIAEKIVADKDEVTWFGLDDHQFVVNDRSMPDSLLVKFRTEFIKQGRGFYYGSVKVTGQGYFYSKQDIYGQ